MTAISPVPLETLSSPPITVMVQESSNQHVMTEKALRYDVTETMPYLFPYTQLSILPGRTYSMPPPSSPNAVLNGLLDRRAATVIWELMHFPRWI